MFKLMSNIKFENSPSFMNSVVDINNRPGRYAIATNLIMCTQNSDGEYGFLLFNYEPEKWNQWYPYFSSTNSMYEFTGHTYQEILDDFVSGPLTTEAAANRFDKAQKAVMDLLHIESLSIKESPVPVELWLKFSKTQNLWTFYYMEFLQIVEASQINISELDSNVVTFLPLDDVTIAKVLESGKYKGIEVVENTLAILNDNELLNLIKQNSIII